MLIILYGYILQCVLFQLVQQNKTPIFEVVRQLLSENDSPLGHARCALRGPLCVCDTLLCHKSYIHRQYTFDNNKHVVG